MYSLPRLTARLAVAASFAALLTAACSPDSKDVSSLSGPTLSAARQAGGGAAASDFVVLANAGVTCTDGTINGSVGTFLAPPTGAFTNTRCVITGTSHLGDAAAVAAYNAYRTEYAALAPVLGDCDAAHTLPSTIAASLTLAPGVYCTGAALTATDVTLTLDAGGNPNATWLFKIGSSGTAGTGALTGTNFSVIMAGGGQACNVTWWVSQAATITTSIATPTTFSGNILAGAAITLTQEIFNGNAWAGASGVGDVTMTGTTINGCADGAADNGKDCHRKGHHHKNHHDKGHHHDKHHDKHHDSKGHDSKGHDSKGHDSKHSGRY